MNLWNPPSAHLAGIGAVDPFATASVAPQGVGLVPMVIEQSGRGERAFDIYATAQGTGDLSGRSGDRRTII